MRFLIISCLFLVCISCKDKFREKKEIKTECVTGVEPVKKVLFVGWDGVRTDAMELADTPCLDTLIQHSYYHTATNRGAYTVSVPGWSTILHGVWPAKHNLETNAFDNNDYYNYPDIFTLARRVKPDLSCATLSNWQDFLRITENENYAQRYDSDEAVKTDAITVINDCTPDIMLLHFDKPDNTGHSSGFSPSNANYLNAISECDTLLSEIMTVIEEREANLNEEWMVVVTTDHGGAGTTHANQYYVEETRYIWFVAGTPNKNGATYLNNPTPSIIDLLPTMLKWLDIDVDPVWDLDGVAVY